MGSKEVKNYNLRVVKKGTKKTTKEKFVQVRPWHLFSIAAK